MTDTIEIPKADETPKAISATEPLVLKGEVLSTSPPPADFDDVAFGGLSLRGILASILIGAVITFAGFGIIKPDVVVSMALIAFGFYFGNKK